MSLEFTFEFRRKLFYWDLKIRPGMVITFYNGGLLGLRMRTTDNKDDDNDKDN